ncbi:MAG: metallophosphoesterase family protein [Promethearchaeota archaeon]|nr:MAG: metallophosphoesterase family protein [Candidatus Lokiarchaeota archaeon]
MNINKSKIILAILLISSFFLYCFLIIINININIENQTVEKPENIHLTWQRDPSTTMTITWQTSFENSGDMVFYDNISRPGYLSSYRNNVSGYNMTYSGASGYLHIVELTGLKANTTYFFICGGQMGYSPERSFRTLPQNISNLRFVVGGDSRTNIGARENISKIMAKYNPNFAIHTGDMVEDGRIQWRWDNWFGDVDSNWVGNNGLTIPIIPVIGNHEQNAINYYSQFVLPGNEMYYSYNLSNNVHISVLSTETDTSGEQLIWLENDLSRHQNFTWKFVTFHQPAIPGSRENGHSGARNNWVPLFDKYHVDMIFNGHDHIYLRTFPINLTHSEDPQSFDNGTVHIITGGWGAPLYEPGTHWYDAYTERPSVYHFCVINIYNNNTLNLQAVNSQENVFDELWIRK